MCVYPALLVLDPSLGLRSKLVLYVRPAGGRNAAEAARPHARVGTTLMASGERGDSPRSFTRRRTAPSEVFRRMCVSAPSPRRIIPSPEACVSSASTETRKPIDVAMLPVNKRTSSVRELVMAGLRKVQSVPGTGGGNPVVGTPVSPVLTARVALFNAPASNNDGGGDDVVSKWSALAMSMAPVSTPTVGVNNENGEWRRVLAVGLPFSQM